MLFNKSVGKSIRTFHLNFQLNQYSSVLGIRGLCGFKATAGTNIRDYPIKIFAIDYFHSQLKVIDKIKLTIGQKLPNSWMSS